MLPNGALNVKWSTQHLFEFPAYLTFDHPLHNRCRNGKSDHDTHRRLQRFNCSRQRKSQNLESKIKRVRTRPRFLKIGNRVSMLFFDFCPFFFQPLRGFRLSKLMINGDVQVWHEKRELEKQVISNCPYSTK